VSPSNNLASGKSPMRKTQMTLTEQERQVLLAELAEITAEIDALQQRTAEVIERVTPRTSIRLARSA
jgi:hypothetical protein